jgi:hypothetical protein
VTTHYQTTRNSGSNQPALATNPQASVVAVDARYKRTRPQPITTTATTQTQPNDDDDHKRTKTANTRDE